MSDEKPKRWLEPAWVGVAVLLLGQVVMYGRAAERDDNTSAQVVELQAWRTKTEQRLSESDKQAAVAAAQVASELRFMNANLDALRRSLESRGIPVQAPTVSPQ